MQVTSSRHETSMYLRPYNDNVHGLGTKNGGAQEVQLQMLDQTDLCMARVWTVYVPQIEHIALVPDELTLLSGTVPRANAPSSP